ncbi:MAG: TonB-dependent receptor [Flavobacteriales bacterium]|nr:TonB-dependent receptor [Flavobacteriales bacterium]
MKNKFSLLLLSLLIGPVLLAQKPLPSDTFRVVKEYKPTIEESDKISIEPEINDSPQKLEQKLKYTFLRKQIPVSFQVEPISAAKIKGEPLVKLYNGYAKLGVGNALVPMGEIYYNNLRSKKFALGTHIKYSRLKELNAIKGSDMSQFHAEVFGKRFWKTNTLSSALSFDMHNFNYYGYNQIDETYRLPETVARTNSQQYNRFAANVGIQSTKKDSFNLRHAVNLKYNLLNTKYKTDEHHIVLSGNLSQFVNKELYNLDVLWDYNDYKYASNNSIAAILPQISTIGKNFKINAGLGVYMNAGNEATFHFYPLAEIKYNVIKDYLVPYAGIKGQIRRNNFNTISLENPFVADAIGIANTNEKINAYGGFRGTLSKVTSFNLMANYMSIENEYFYVKAYPGVSFLNDRFSLIYDNLDLLEFKGELAYRSTKKIKLYLIGQYFDYSTEHEMKAWHRPDIKITTIGEYNLQEKLIAKLSLFYWGEQYAKTIEIEGTESVEKAEKLKGIIDANLGFEYRYTKKLSAFIDFNNIGGIRYEKYQDYPTQGFNVFGGLTYSF